MIALTNSQPCSNYMQEKSYVEQALNEATTAKEGLMVVIHALDHLCTTYSCVKEHAGEIIIDHADYSKRKKAMFVTETPTINTPLDGNATEVLYHLTSRATEYMETWMQSELFKQDPSVSGELILLTGRFVTMGKAALGLTVIDFPIPDVLSVPVARYIDWGKSDVKSHYTIQPQSDKKLQYVYVFEK